MPQSFGKFKLTKYDKQVQVLKKQKVQSLEEIKAANNTSRSCLSALAISLGTLKLYNYNK